MSALGARPVSMRSGLIDEARERAHTIGRPVLLSIVEPVGAADPLELIESASSLDRSSRQLIGCDDARMYWGRPSDGFSLASIGAASVIAPSGSARFADAQREWSTLLESAFVHDEDGGGTGTGPLLLGGFAFDAGDRTARWRDFSDSRLVLPRLLLTTSGNSRHLTINLLVDEEGACGVDPAALASAGHALVRRASRAAGARRESDARLAAEGSDVIPAAQWKEMVAEAVVSIKRGDFEKVVLAREVRVPIPADVDVIATLRALRAACDDCYVFGVWSGTSVFVGASPERLVRLDGSSVRASSLAGSIRRGLDAGEDASLAAELQSSAKDREEHELVRRFLCESLAELCDDVTASATPFLLTLPQVHHLHTPVTGRLRPGHSLLELVDRLHPTPAVGGSPRTAALAFLRQHERLDRGWYAAPVGWLQRDHGEFAAALRSALLTDRDASLFAGCGLVADSDPEREYAESQLKLRPMQLALGEAIGRDRDS